MKIVPLQNINELKEVLGLQFDGLILEENLDPVTNETELFGRRLLDAQVLTTIAANSEGDCLDIGTSYGHSAFKLATNIRKNGLVFTINLLPHQASNSGVMTTHIIETEEIGSFFKEKKVQNIKQIFANTAHWSPPIYVQNLAIAFIDGCHDREFVYSDTQLVYPLVRVGGFILWHDFSPLMREKFRWVDAAMSGVEEFFRQKGLNGEILHVRHSWIGIYRKQLPALPETLCVSKIGQISCFRSERQQEPQLHTLPGKNAVKICNSPNEVKLGLVLNRAFHQEGRWVSVLTPKLVEGLLQAFNCIWIENQKQLEEVVGEVDVIISMEPGWAAPRLNFQRTSGLREAFGQRLSYILYSDPHANQWRESYFLENKINYILGLYLSPFLHHFRRIDSKQLIHFPWAVPDEWIFSEPISLNAPGTICCFGASKHEAYEVRNWCRTFPFVASHINSGVENPIYSDQDYFKWLERQDACIAAGSDSLKYRLTVPKYFEIAASGALLFAQETDDLERLGFRHIENCVIFSRQNFFSQATEYLKKPEKYLKIRENGRDLIRAYHSLSKRLGFLRRLIIDHSEQSTGAIYWNVAPVSPVNVRNNALIPDVTVKDSRSLDFNAIGVRKGKSLPRILFIVDAPNWAHDYKTDNIIRALQGKYEFSKQYQNEVTETDLDQADLIVIYYWLQIGRMPRIGSAIEKYKEKLLIGICSHFELENERRQPGLNILNRLASAVFVNNLLLFHELKTRIVPPLFYTPNGVDTNFYSPGEKISHGEVLHVGWAGSLKNHGAKRGYFDYIIPAVQKNEGVRLITADRESNWRTQEQMLKFYRSLDIYVCASRTEGTPNPCLEAAACGVPIVTTWVGNMPELIDHGVNGFIVDRNVASIAKHISLLKNNPRLRQAFSASIHKSIKGWDWRNRAINYEAMFDALLSYQESTILREETYNNKSISLMPGTKGDFPTGSNFCRRSDIYLASADKMSKVITNRKKLRESKVVGADTYATVIGGLSGLNYLTVLKPRKIVFFDLNISMLDYGRLLLEMIHISNSHRDFISRIFSRSVDKFLNEGRYSELDWNNQSAYLRTKVDIQIIRDNFAKLTGAARVNFRKFLFPHLKEGVLSGRFNCRRLLPCWPIDKRMPVGAGQVEGYNEKGQLEPNTNSFFYGHGWLENQKAFLSVRNILKSAELQLLPFDVLKQDLKCIGGLNEKIVLHVSNIDDWFPSDWKNCLSRWASEAINQWQCLTIITTQNGIIGLHSDAHLKALRAVKPFISGRTVEVTHKVPWGFHEIERQNVSVDNYLAKEIHADTTLLHILCGEGVAKHKFEAVMRKAIRISERIILLEHNKDSIDWEGKRVESMLSENQIAELSHNIEKEGDFAITCSKRIMGEKDDRRNIIVVMNRQRCPKLALKKGDSSSGRLFDRII